MFHCMQSKKDIDELFAGNSRYKSWETRNENGVLVSFTFGFKSVRNPKKYWKYDMTNDFDICPTEFVLYESVSSLKQIIRKGLIKKYPEYANLLLSDLNQKLNFVVTDSDIYRIKSEIKDVYRWLDELKRNDENE